ncbi:hypothetical protein ACFLXO_01295 [Chloroflexota bacterium]
MAIDKRGLGVLLLGVFLVVITLVSFSVKFVSIQERELYHIQKQLEWAQSDLKAMINDVPMSSDVREGLKGVLYRVEDSLETIYDVIRRQREG